jgi:dihydroflavonol-4-reductase
MKALVTGGTGFVGSHVVRQLTEQGHTARVLHRKSSKLTALEGLTYETAYGDVTELDALRKACEGVEIVYHVAAVADYWRADVKHMFDVNVQGTQNVLDAAQENGVRRVVFTSSAAAIGFLDDRPSDETVPFNMSEKHFPYGYSKKLAQDLVGERVKGGQDIVTVNPVVIMGPGDINVISGTFMVQMKRFGMFTPSTSGGVAVIDVRDVARYHLLAAEKGISGEKYVLTTANYSYGQWFKMIAEVVGVRPPLLTVPSFLLPLGARLIDLARSLGIPTPIDANQVRLGAKNIFFNGEKAWQAFGKPRIDMMQSLHDTYAWYKAHGVMR